MSKLSLQPLASTYTATSFGIGIIETTWLGMDKNLELSKRI